MQREKSLALRAVEKRGGLCFAVARGGCPCEREAVVPRPEPGETEIVLCEEHALAHRHALDAEDLFNALEMLHEWMQDGAPSDDSPGGSLLRDALYHQLDELERRYFDVLVKEQGAALVAAGAPTGPGGECRYPPSLEAAEALVRSNMVVDGLNNARAVVEDAPTEAFSRPYERYQIAAVLKAAYEDAARAGREAQELSGLWA